MIGFTGISIAPELGLHFEAGSLDCCCPCLGTDPRSDEDSERYYITKNLKVRRWSDRRGNCDGEAASHVRLKLLVVKRLDKFTVDPFEAAETVFRRASVSWLDTCPITKGVIDRINLQMERIKVETLNDEPI